MRMRMIIFSAHILATLTIIVVTVFILALNAYGMEPEERSNLMSAMDRMDPGCHQEFLSENTRILMKTVRSL